MAKRILVGTATGLIVYRYLDEDVPTLEKVHFAGFKVNMLFCDPRNGRWWLGLGHKHWGQKLHCSDDQGENWQSVPMPTYQGTCLPDGNPAKMRQIWAMQHGGFDRPHELWMGTEPGALFHSHDGGQTFQIVKSLWDHPSRQREGQWFGAGSEHPFIHSIAIDPRDSDHLYVAVSCAGVFESKDGGATWQPKNKGTKAAYLPNPNVEVGHDPHLLLISPSHPQVLWQQNHCGVYHTSSGADQWHDVSGKDGMPYYGFGIAIDAEDPAKAWVIPVESDEQRIAPDLRLRVYRTDDFGKSWIDDSQGLPQSHVFDIVLRQSMARLDRFMAFGTTNGNLYYRPHDQHTWLLLSHHLTRVQALAIIPA